MSAAVPPRPDFRSADFLRDHIRWMVGFHVPRAVDPRGGFFHGFAHDGSIIRPDRKALVSSARMVVSFAMAARALGDERLRDAARHGLAFLLEHHRDPHGGYAWELEWDGTRFIPSVPSYQAYGLVHVVLALAHAHAVGLDGARAALDDLVAVMDRHAFEPEFGLYREEFEPGWLPLGEYRGQNANMHGCEAFLAAHAATGEARFLERANTLADGVTRRLAAQTDGLIWENFGHGWRLDPDHGRGDAPNPYRALDPQTGHQTEWAKFLVELGNRTGEAWPLARARELFDFALAAAWDDDHGGLAMAIGPEGEVRDFAKVFWVQIESAVAAARLARATGDARYLAVHDDLWAVSWERFVDHRVGSWHREFTRDWRLSGPDKGSGGKDYHVVGACFDLLALA